MTNQREIAVALGLSTATVSRALRGRGHHDARTRALVREAAERLGYRLPDRAVAEPVASGRIPAIGVTIAGAHERGEDLPSVALRMLRGISGAARAAGMMLHIEYVPQEGLGPDPLDSPALRAGNLAGLIHIGEPGPAVLGALSERFPGVRLALRDPTVPMDCVAQDDLGSVLALVEHLRGLGHERIGFFGAGGASSYAGARAAGHIQALLRHGVLPADLALVNVTGQHQPAAACAVEVLAHVARGVRAWVCVHDARGYELAAMLAQAGMRVPAQVSVCGFDALPGPAGLPRLTGIDWPFEEMGAEAVRLLRARIAGPAEPTRHVVFPGTLVAIGASAGPPG